MTVQCPANRGLHRRAMALMLTLVLTAVAGMALGESARRTLRVCAAADEAANGLRFRWTVRSLAGYVRDGAGQMIDGSSQPDTLRSASSERWRTQLNGYDIVMVVGDEQAKLNVNTIPSPISSIGSLPIPIDANIHTPTLKTTLSSPREVEPQPTEKDSPREDQGETTEREGWQASFDTVLPNTTASQLAPVGEEAALTDVLTCWGDGRLNVTRASDDVLRAALGGSMTRVQIDRFLRERTRHHGTDDVSAALRASGADQELVQALQEQLVSESLCYSLWLCIQDEHDHERHALIVWEYAREGEGASVIPKPATISRKATTTVPPGIRAERRPSVARTEEDPSELSHPSAPQPNGQQAKLIRMLRFWW